MWDERVPVLIVGAGLAGASTAMFLGLHGVPSLVVERHPSTSNQPKARGQSWHTMEALRQAGVAERIADAGWDLSLGMPIVIAESVTGRVLHEIIGEAWPDLSELSPAPMGMAGQERAEAILVERARELGAEFRFGTKLVSFEQDDDGVTAVLADGTTRGGTTGAERTVRADYLAAAEGWRGEIRTAAGIGTHGRGELSHSVSVIFDSDETLTAALKGREYALFYLQNPALGGAPGAFVSTDVPGRWVALFDYDPTVRSADSYTEAELIEKVRILVGADDLTVNIVDRTSFTIAHRVADRFSAGRLFLIGDTAHAMPPTGGQGGNTAVMDGFYLAWKLAAVVRGWAGPKLLDSHDVERRPYGELVAGQQYSNMIVRQSPHLRDGTEDELIDPVRTLLGYRYPDGAVVPEPDEDGARTEDPAHPTGRPGSHAPHVWLTRDGDSTSQPSGGDSSQAERLSTIDLFGPEFVLLTESESWAKAAAEVATRLEVPLRTEILNAPGTPTGDWRTKYGVASDGATLVRPDRFIAWRSVHSAGTPTADADALTTALRQILSR